MPAVPIQTAPPFFPSQVKRRTCCFFIPARWATMLLAITAATISAMHGIQACIRLFRPEHFNGLLVWLDVAQIVLWFSLVVICLYGFSGCMVQRFLWVDWFYDLAWWHVWINTILGIYTLTWLNLPSSRDFAISVCLKSVINPIYDHVEGDEVKKLVTSVQVATSACVGNIKLSLLLLDFCWTIAILVELYLVMVIAHYLDELADLDAARKYQVDIENPTAPFSFPEVEQDPLFQVKRSSRF